MITYLKKIIIVSVSTAVVSFRTHLKRHQGVGCIISTIYFDHQCIFVQSVPCLSLFVFMDVVLQFYSPLVQSEWSVSNEIQQLIQLFSLLLQWYLLFHHYHNRSLSDPVGWYQDHNTIKSIKAWSLMWKRTKTTIFWWLTDSFR